MIARDLDEKKQLYAELKIPEYWVIDVREKRVLAFRLGEMGKYQECDVLGALEGLQIALLNETLEQLTEREGVPRYAFLNKFPIYSRRKKEENQGFCH